MLSERGPKDHPLLGGCPFLGGSYIGGSTVHMYEGERSVYGPLCSLAPRQHITTGNIESQHFYGVPE